MSSISKNFNEVTVEQLRKEKYRVRVTHSRTYVTNEFFYKTFVLSKFDLYEMLNTIPADESILGPLEFGGQTTIEISTPDGKEVVGVAACSDKDRWVRKVGLKKALCRALAQLNKV
jgi:hypothetical protein